MSPRRLRLVLIAVALPVAAALLVIGAWSSAAAAQVPFESPAVPDSPTAQPVVPAARPGEGMSQLVVVEVPPHTVPITNSGVAPMGLLPRTGSSVAPWLIQLAVVLVVAGLLMVVAGRRAEHRRRHLAGE